VQQVEKRIVDDCHLIGLIPLEPINPESVPRFSCPISKINFVELITRAYHFSRIEEREKSK